MRLTQLKDRQKQRQADRHKVDVRQKEKVADRKERESREERLECARRKQTAANGKRQIPARCDGRPALESKLSIWRSKWVLVVMENFGTSVF